jgi:hypothetical protein
MLVSVGIALILVAAGALWRWDLLTPVLNHDNGSQGPTAGDRKNNSPPPGAIAPASPEVASRTQPEEVSPGDSRPESTGGAGQPQETADSVTTEETVAPRTAPPSPKDTTEAVRTSGGTDQAALPGADQTVATAASIEPAPVKEMAGRTGLTTIARTATLASIESLIADLDCARIETSLSPERVLTLSGHLGSEEDLSSLRSRLLGLEHVERLEDHAVHVYQWPFCEVIATLGNALDGADASTREAGILLNGPGPVYREGEYLVVTAMNNNPDSGYIYLDYVDAAGEVVHMLPTATDPDNKMKGWGQVVVGSEDEKSCLERQCYEISPPHGRNLLVAVWSRAPLVSGPRQQPMESAADYFSSLAESIRRARTNGRGEIAASYRFLETRQ